MRLITTICLFILFFETKAQTVSIWMKDGFLKEFAVSEVDSLVFNNSNNMEQARIEIESFLKRWNKAMIEADTVTLNDMMDDEIQLHHITGAAQTKQEWLAEVGSGSMEYHKIEMRNVAVDIMSSGKAKVSFTSIITATIWGAYGTWTLNVGMTLEKRNGNWIRTE